MQIYGKSEILKDKNDQPYVAIDIKEDQYSPFAEFMLKNNFHEDVERKLKRDKGCYHVTVINAAQWGGLRKKGLAEEIFTFFEGKDFSFSVHGIGKAEKDDNKAYFVILENLELAQLREKYGLPTHDFHMTLAFNEKDVHGVSKNKDTCIYSNEEILKALNKNKSFKL